MALGALDIIIAADTAQLRKGMDTAVGIMQSSTQKMESFAKTAGASITSYFALSNLQASIKTSLDLADSLSKMSQKVGVSVDALYSMQAAGKLADIDMQTLEKSLLKFNKGLGTASMGSGDTANALKNLGISLKDSSGNLKDSDKYLFEVADKFKAMPDGIAKTTLAMQLFGKSGADMIPLLNGGSESLQQFSGIINTQTAQAAEKFNDSLTTVGLAADAVWMQMTSSLSPTLSAIADDFVNVANSGKDTGHTLGSDLAQGAKIAIGLGYNIVGSFSMAAHALGNFGAAASLLAEGDFKGAKFAWNKMQSDFEAEGRSWDTRLQKVMSATSESQKASDDNRSKTRQDLEDFKRAESEKEAIVKKATADRIKLQNEAKKYAEEEAKIQKGYLESYAELQAKSAIEEYENKLKYEESYTDIQAQNAIKAYELELDLSDKTKKLTLSDYDYSISKLNDQYEEYAKVTDDKLLLDQWYNAEKLKIEKDNWAENNKFLSGLFDNMNKAMQDQFFNSMNGKFTSFGNWLKDFWSSITQSMSRGLSKSLADSIMGTNDSAGGIQNIFKSFGGLGSVFGSAATPAALIGATTDSAGFTTTLGGTVLDASGQITKEGSDVTSVISAISGAKTAYELATAGISSSVADAFASGAAYSYNGLTALGMSSETAGGIAGGIGNFGAGLSSPWASAGAGGMEGAGAMLGGAALGAAGGYALGSIGDKAFGTDTKAGTYGAIGGAVGAMVGGPVGAVIGAALGSLVGGMFGSTKVKGSGYYFGSSTEDGSNAQTYVDYKKKSWFSSSSWTTYSALSDVEKSKIKGLFDTYDYLLVQLGTSKEITLAAGRYAGTTFQDQLAKNFITAFTDVEQSSSTFSTIYSYWTDYAKSINQTISQAFATSIGTYVSSTRSFNEWKLGSGTVEQLKFTSDYLTKDLAALENQMGVSGITVENYLSKYDEAMKTAFTPETINSWKSLGEAIIAQTDANNKYTDSIKALSSYTKPSDMMLSRTGDATSITGKSDGTVNTAMLDVLQKMWKEMQDQTRIAQLNRGMA